MQNESRTEKTIRRKRRRKKRYLLRFFLLLLICVGIYHLLHLEYFNIQGIAVAGNIEITDQEIRELSEIKAGENIFDIHPWFAERKIKKNLYIADVDVSRKFPDEVEIAVKERRGKTQILMDGKYVVTDNEGMVLELSKKEKQVTLVMDLAVLKADRGKTLQVEETAAWEKAAAMIMAAEENDLYFKKIKIKSNKTEAYVYDGLVCRGRYDHVMECIQSGALKSVVFDLYQKDIETGVISIGSNNYCAFTE